MSAHVADREVLEIARGTIRVLTVRIEELERVLQPFSDFAAGIHPSMPDDMPLTMGSRMARRQVTAGDFRRAALAQTGEPTE